MKKRVFAMLLVAMLAVSSFIGCGSTDNQVTTTSADKTSSADTTEATTEPEIETKTIKVMFNDYYGYGVQRLNDVTSKLNEMLEAKGYHVQVEFIMTESSALEEQLTLKVLGGEQIDLLISTAGLALKYQSQDMFLDMDPYLDTYGKDIKAAFYDNGMSEILDRCYYNGSLYYVPNIEPKAIGMMLIVNKDMLDEVGMTLDNVKCMEDMEPIYEAVHAKHPDVYCFGNFMPSTTLISGEGYILWDSMRELNSMTDGLGVLEKYDSTTVVNLYETDGYLSAAKTLKKWMDAGYLMKDLATSTEMGFNFFKSGKQFSVKMTTEMDLEETNAWLPKVIKDVNAIAVPVSDQIISSTRGASCIPVTAKEPEAAVRFLNALFTDGEIMDTLCFGIRGEDWDLDENEAVIYLTEDGNQNQAYQTPFFMTTGNRAIAHAAASQGGKAYIDKIYARNAAATLSATYGFSYDSSEVSSEVGACSNAVAEFKMGIETGSVDPVAELAKLNAKLKDSGIDDIIKEKQAQYDEFLKNCQ